MQQFYSLSQKSLKFIHALLVLQNKAITPRERDGQCSILNDLHYVRQANTGRHFCTFVGKFANFFTTEGLALPAFEDLPKSTRRVFREHQE
ncbi:hypothetical protein CEXT_198471 [Caerostris extrusa]|uniref:Uncharacterized protein n=1 Tax=Caerostris extrusa TaxID=172846 RepID=A0AAV4XQS6_CAEEX|nr:hypothetical protein CEXT_198471 [Caerostris extrusa]